MNDTQETILSAAMRLFAAKGLRAVTVREICKAAGVNVAMINYHFRGKDGLYRACMERLFHQQACLELAELPKSVRDAKTWKAAIRSWIFRFSRALRSSSGGAALVAGFFRHEVTHPSPMDQFIREHYVQPVYDSISRLFAMAVKDADERRRWVESVWSQLSVYALTAPAWHTLFRPERADPEAWGDAFAEFICERIFGELKYSPQR